MQRCWRLAQTATVLSARRCTRTRTAGRRSHAHDQPPEIRRHRQVRGEDRISSRQTIWDALFGSVRAAHVQVQTARRRPVTRERMAVLCRGSND
jgi:hypothetical protein